MGIDAQRFGSDPEGNPVDLFSLDQPWGIQAQVSNWGATITSIRAPDRKGQFDDVVLGYDDLGSYLDNPAYFGATVGRCAGRIAKGTFTLNGRQFDLPQNEGEHHLHGGTPGFSHRRWDAEICGNSVVMQLVAPDGDQGYPGTLNITATFTLISETALEVRYEGICDQDTIINLTNHTYFNLAGAGNDTVCSHDLNLRAETRLNSDPNWIPTGETKAVAETEYDFRSFSPIGSGIFNDYYLLPVSSKIQTAAMATEHASGRTLEVLTNQPGVQLYTGYYLDEPAGRGKKAYGAYSGFCLETQFPPDAPNHPEFPSIRLAANTPYNNTTIFRFGTCP